ncbi:hypothetical protein [Enterovibrio paralichthyis]|uniref:hypothetical protein n=1 Tax=Enterovibrio paralichthyis TaxID=2853805 RepID=UPI001C450A85|nr:hypothetical protein [Enterovibrio paralichthyis]MBV7300449.1 hypothetical protein [Enterovibrio paralichthyis]
MKRIVLSVLAAMTLMGCQATTQESPYVPTAKQKAIEAAQRAFADQKLVDVTDDGFIIFTQGLEPKQYWRTSVIREAGYDIACDKLLPFVESGFVVQVRFKGQGGINDFYNAERCASMMTN